MRVTRAMRDFCSAIASLSVVALLAGINPAAAQTAVSGSSAEDCKEYGVDYRKTEGLTQREILARMDRALHKSLNKYDDCLQQSTAASTASGGGSSGGGGSGGGSAGADGGGAGGGASGQGAVSSAAASGIEGTEKSSASASNAAGGSSAPSGQLSGDSPQVSQQESGPSGSMTGQSQSPAVTAGGSGRAPEDIPPSDNDSVLQQKVREAAMNEADPEKSARLWNEYRKLKGIPQK